MIINSTTEIHSVHILAEMLPHQLLITEPEQQDTIIFAIPPQAVIFYSWSNAFDRHYGEYPDNLFFTRIRVREKSTLITVFTLPSCPSHVTTRNKLCNEDWCGRG